MAAPSDFAAGGADAFRTVIGKRLAILDCSFRADINDTPGAAAIRIC